MSRENIRILEILEMKEEPLSILVCPHFTVKICQ